MHRLTYGQTYAVLALLLAAALVLSASVGAFTFTPAQMVRYVTHADAAPGDLLAVDGLLLETSWYGDTAVELGLGSAFHSRRLTMRASQVGTVSPARALRRTHADRLRLALDLLRDPAFDVLLTGSSPFADLPTTMAALASGRAAALCHTIDYEEA